MKIKKERTGCVLSVKSNCTPAELKRKMSNAAELITGIFVPSDVSWEGNRYTFYISHRQSLKEYIYEYGITISEYFLFLIRLGQMFEELASNDIFPYDIILDYECIFIGDSITDTEFIYAPDAEVLKEDKIVYNKCSDIAAIISLNIESSDYEDKEKRDGAVQYALKILSEWESCITKENCIFPKEAINEIATPWISGMRFHFFNIIKDTIEILKQFCMRKRNEALKLKLDGEMLLKGMSYSAGNIKDAVQIGRDTAWADVTIGYPFVSRKHAMLYKENDEWYIKDLNSKNGTFVNGIKIETSEPFHVKDGFEISLGIPETKFILCLP